MAKPIPELVNDVMAQLDALILKAPADKQPKTPEAVTKIAKGVLSNAFDGLTEAEKKDLYKKLSLKLHPDKFPKSNPELYEYLCGIHAQAEIFKELNNYQTKNNAPNAFEEVAQDPLQGGRKVFVNLQKQLDKFFNAYKRYPQPLRAIVRGTQWLVNIVLATGVIAGGLILLGVYWGLMKPVTKLTKALTNGITGSGYEQERIKYLYTPAGFEFAKSVFMRGARTLLSMQKPELATQFMEMTNEQLYQILVLISFKQKAASHEVLTEEQEKALRAEARAELDAKILNGAVKAKMAPNHMEPLLLARALGHAIAKPLPKGVGKQILEILVIRPLITLATPFILLASATMHLLNYTAVALAFTAGAVVVALKLATGALLNLPLYVVDAGRAMVSCCHKKGDKQPKPGKQKGEDKGNEDVLDATETNNARMNTTLGRKVPAPDNVRPSPQELGNFAVIISPAPSNQPAFDTPEQAATTVSCP